MHTVTVHQVPTLVLGEGCARAAGAWLASRGYRCPLMVTGRSGESLKAQLRELWKGEGLELRSVSPVPPEPTVRQYGAVLREAREQEPDAVVGHGQFTKGFGGWVGGPEGSGTHSDNARPS